MGSSAIALVTCQRLLEPDDDAQILRDAIISRGFDASWVAWDNDQVSWSSYSIAVIRSTWNYYHHYKKFMTWLEFASQSTHVLNEPDAIKWNVHKGYLGNMGKHGIEIIPTQFASREEGVDFASLLDQRGWSQAVIKPTISAASHQTYRFHRDQADEAQRVLSCLLADQDMMIQEYMDSVEQYGERSLIWIDGQVTHAIRKNPRFSGDHEHVSQAIDPADDELEFATRVIGQVRERLLYARVDIMRDAKGQIRLSELELVEPSLFLQMHPPALERFADSIVREALATRPNA